MTECVFVDFSRSSYRPWDLKPVLLNHCFPSAVTVLPAWRPRGAEVEQQHRQTSLCQYYSRHETQGEFPPRQRHSFVLFHTSCQAADQGCAEMSFVDVVIRSSQSSGNLPQSDNVLTRISSVDKRNFLRITDPPPRMTLLFQWYYFRSFRLLYRYRVQVRWPSCEQLSVWRWRSIAE